MRRDNKQKNIIIIVLLISIIGLSIGFSAFSDKLNISSSAQVKMNDDKFKVVFSNSSTTLD